MEMTPLDISICHEMAFELVLLAARGYAILPRSITGYRDEVHAWAIRDRKHLIRCGSLL